MALKKVFPISILICTNNRPEKLKKCILSILKQTFLPQEVLIADSSDTKVNKKWIGSFFDKNQEIHKEIIEVNKKLIPLSRNLLVSLAKNDLCIFVDDDVVLNKKVLEIFYNFMSDDTETTILGGVCKPDKKNVYSEYMYKVLFDYVLKSSNKIVDVNYCPTMIFGFKKSFLIKNKIFFDERIKNLEDIDLCLQVIKKNGKVLINKDMKGFHSYRDNLMELYKSFYNYYCNIEKNYQKYSIDFFDLKKYFNKKKEFNGWKYLFNGDGSWLSLVRRFAMFMAMNGKRL